MKKNDTFTFTIGNFLSYNILKAGRKSTKNKGAHALEREEGGIRLSPRFVSRSYHQDSFPIDFVCKTADIYMLI